MKKIMKSIFILLLCLTTWACNFQNKGIKETKEYQAEDLTKLITEAYRGIIADLPELNTYKITDEEEKNSVLAYKDDTKPSFIKNIETMVASTPKLSTEPYSFILIKVDNKANIKKIKKEIIDNVDLWTWKYVGAEVAYVNNYGSVIMLIMTDKDTAQKVYDGFNKATNNKLNTKLEKNND